MSGCPGGPVAGHAPEQHRELWPEPAHAGWLALPDFRALPVQVRLLEAAVLDRAPGRRARCRAVDWALRPVPLVWPAAATALRPAALVLAAHACARGEHSADTDIVTRLCGHTAQQTGGLPDRLVATRTLKTWQDNRETDEVFWQLPQ